MDLLVIIISSLLIFSFSYFYYILFIYPKRQAKNLQAQWDNFQKEKLHFEDFNYYLIKKGLESTFIYQILFDRNQEIGSDEAIAQENEFIEFFKQKDFDLILSKIAGINDNKKYSFLVACFWFYQVKVKDMNPQAFHLFCLSKKREFARYNYSYEVYIERDFNEDWMFFSRELRNLIGKERKAWKEQYQFDKFLKKGPGHE